MKKLLSMILVLAALLAIFAVPANAAEVALVTDVGTIDDESFNQACWQGVEAYAKANNLSYQYYQPAADSDDERLGSIDQAVSDGAKVVVLPGYLFGATVAQAQEMYPDVCFIAVDVSAGDLGTDPLENLYCAVFGEEQAGYLTGYAIVKDGFTNLLRSNLVGIIRIKYIRGSVDYILDFKFGIEKLLFIKIQPTPLNKNSPG